MAMKQKKNGESEKLALIPSLSPDAVREQLEAQVRAQNGPETKIPQKLVLEICASAKRPRLQSIAESLGQIARFSGSAAENAFFALSRHSIASAFSKNPKRIADALGQMQNAMGIDAFDEALMVLARKPIAEAFAKNPAKISKALSLIGSKGTPGASEAIWLLGTNKCAREFAQNPEKITNAILRIRGAAGDNSKEAFSALTRPNLSLAFAQDTAGTTLAFVRMAEDFGTSSAKVFLHLATKKKDYDSAPKRFRSSDKGGSGMAVAATLLMREDFALAFLQNPNHALGTIIRLNEIFGKDEKGGLLSPSNEPLLPLFARNFREVSDALEDFSKIEGVGQDYAYNFLRIFAREFAASPHEAGEAIASAARIAGRKSQRINKLLLENPEFKDEISKDLGNLVKLAEASCYSTLIKSLEIRLKDARPNETKELASGLSEPESLVAKIGAFRSKPYSYKGKWGDGRELAREAGLFLDDREAFINFAYAKDQIGKEKTIALHKEFGIEYFARYSKEELEELYKHTKNIEDNRPLLIIAHNKYDYSGSFYDDYEYRSSLLTDGYYNVIFIEAETEDEFYKRVKSAGERYFGISVLQISAHGDPRRMEMGAADTEKSFIDLTDLGKLRRLRRMFAEDAIVILSSCSTGQDEWALGARISSAWKAELIAPSVPTSTKGYITENKRIVGVEYGRGGKRFINGREAGK
ncbi:hypothetical protein JW721_02910 [Candidatus Micrarchaeota archaeon]|nr:hypothetical protein [Candidatus Micrarchaeota archaeon]